MVVHVVDLALPIPTLYAARFRKESLKHGEELVHQSEQTLTKAVPHNPTLQRWQVGRLLLTSFPRKARSSQVPGDQDH
jgi:hypothetical protein